MHDFATARTRMVDSQIRPNGITDRRILAAMSAVPREAFVPEPRRAVAYMDEDLPVTAAGPGAPRRYLMEPMVFARLLQLAEIGPQERVLDVGCATGYSTAVLARLAGSVVALEEDAALAEIAARTLAAQGVANARVVCGALSRGHPAAAPYDVIVLEGAVPAVPDALLDQLDERGRLVAVVAAGPIGQARRFERNGGAVSRRIAFDAAVPALPGFTVPRPAFVL